MTKIILVRHGETEWNVGEIFRGRIDIALNETGIKQAELLAGYLSQTKTEAIYSSPLKRALHTAEIIAAKHTLNIEIVPGLIDFNYGEWQGLSQLEVKEKYPELYAAWQKNPHLVSMPGGENIADIRERTMEVMNQVITQHQGTTILVSHRVVNKVLICTLLGLDDSHFWQIKQDNCGITTFIYEAGQFVLAEHNNTSYLKILQKGPLGDF